MMREIRQLEELLESFNSKPFEQCLEFRTNLRSKIDTKIVFSNLSEEMIEKSFKKTATKIPNQTRVKAIAIRDRLAKKYGRAAAQSATDPVLKDNDADEFDDINDRMNTIVSLGGIDPKTGRKLPLKSKEMIKKGGDSNIETKEKTKKNLKECFILEEILFQELMEDEDLLESLSPVDSRRWRLILGSLKFIKPEVLDELFPDLKEKSTRTKVKALRQLANNLPSTEKEKLLRSREATILELKAQGVGKKLENIGKTSGIVTGTALSVAAGSSIFSSIGAVSGIKGVALVTLAPVLAAIPLVIGGVIIAIGAGTGIGTSGIFKRIAKGKFKKEVFAVTKEEILDTLKKDLENRKTVSESLTEEEILEKAEYIFSNLTEEHLQSLQSEYDRLDREWDRDDRTGGHRSSEISSQMKNIKQRIEKEKQKQAAVKPELKRTAGAENGK